MAPALMADPRRHTRLVATSLILLLAYALRLYHLGYDSIWYDEGVSIYLAGLDLPAMIAHTAGDIHPPLYYALLHLWSLPAGAGEFSIAFFSLFFGLLLLALTYRVAARFFGPATALLAAFLVAISPFNVWYSQEMRMYTLGSFLALLSTYCLARLMGAGNQARDWRFPWIGYVLSAAAGIYSLYYFFFVLVFQNLCVAALLLKRWKGGHMGPPLRPPADLECADSAGAGLAAKGGAAPARATTRVAPTDVAPVFPWLSAQLAVLVLYLPWLPIAFRQATQPPVPPWRSFTNLWDMTVESWSALSLGQSAGLSWAWPVLALFAVIYLLGLSHPRSAFRPLLVGYTFLPLALILLLSLVVPLYHVRYVFTYAAAFYILIAAGLALLLRRRTALRLALFSVLLLTLTAAAPSPSKPTSSTPPMRRTTTAMPSATCPTAGGPATPSSSTPATFIPWSPTTTRATSPGAAACATMPPTCRRRRQRPARAPCSCRPVPSTGRRSSAGAARPRTFTPPLPPR